MLILLHSPAFSPHLVHRDNQVVSRPVDLRPVRLVSPVVILRRSRHVDPRNNRQQFLPGRRPVFHLVCPQRCHRRSHLGCLRSFPVHNPLRSLPHSPCPTPLVSLPRLPVHRPVDSHLRDLRRLRQRLHRANRPLDPSRDPRDSRLVSRAVDRLVSPRISHRINLHRSRHVSQEPLLLRLPRHPRPSSRSALPRANPRRIPRGLPAASRAVDRRCWVPPCS